MQRIRSLLFIIIGLLSSQAFFLGSANAAQISGGDGYRISPVRSDLTIARGNSQIVNFYIKNVTNTTEHVQTLVNDFVASNKQNGTPSLLLNGQQAPSHGLKQYIIVKTPTFTLNPQQQLTIPVEVSIPKTIAPGGYYAAVRFAPTGLSGKQNVNLSASVASLVLVTVPGNYLQQMNITNFSVNQNGRAGTLFTTSKNLTATVSFNNSGQVQEEPFGKFILLKGNQQIGTYPINNVNPPGNVLPNSIRSFTVNLNNLQGFGKYSVEGYFGYGSNGQLLSSKKTFYLIPYNMLFMAIIIIVLILILLILLVRKMHKTKK